MATTTTPIQLEDLPGISPTEAQRLATDMNGKLLELLESLEPEHWNTITACDPWTVKDIAAHLLGWNEALSSIKEMRSQVVRGIKRSKEFGNPTDAQNNIQVEDRRHLTTDELIERLRVSLPTAVATKKRFGTLLRYAPLYSSYLDGYFTAGYLINTIFHRDNLVHRLDISEATGVDPLVGEADRRVVSDLLKDWARRTGADVRIRLTDAAEGSFVAGTGSAGSITATTTDLVLVLARRKGPDAVTIDGDRTTIASWLAKGCPV